MCEAISKAYRNTLTCAIKRTKDNYYRRSLMSMQVRKTWHFINDILNRNPKGQVAQSITFNTGITSDPKELRKDSRGVLARWELI